MIWHVVSITAAVALLVGGLLIGPHVSPAPGLSRVHVQSVRVDSASGTRSGGRYYSTGGGFGSGK